MQLLISVVNKNEAKAAADGGADIVDVKNPREGALGANFPHIIRSVREYTPSILPVSVAIGDAPNKPGATALAALGAATCNVQYVKVGLYGTKTASQATILLKEVCRAVREYDPHIKIIAAAYADAHIIGALPPMESPFVAKEAGADGCMLDTAVKDGSTLFSHLKEDKLTDFTQNCNNLGLISALAGSLGQADIPLLSKINPDIIGFRGAACTEGDRVEGLVKSSRVKKLKNLIQADGSPL
jgi:uncharacterized protein (UPF0264 family)